MKPIWNAPGYSTWVALSKLLKVKTNPESSVITASTSRPLSNTHRSPK